MGRKPTKPADGPQRAIGYVRVSTAEQARSGAGLDVQRAAITTEVERRGWVLSDVLADEGASGRSMSAAKRPGLGEAVNRLRSGSADVLVVSKLDRLSRSVIDFAGLMAQAQREGWEIVVLDIGVDMTTPHGRLVANIMASVAQWERELIAQRTSDALQIKIAQGVPVGRPHSVAPETVEVIHRLRSSGSTYSAIAAALNDAGVPRGHGGACWHPTTVRSVLLRKRPSAGSAASNLSSSDYLFR